MVTKRHRLNAFDVTRSAVPAFYCSNQTDLPDFVVEKHETVWREKNIFYPLVIRLLYTAQRIMDIGFYCPFFFF